MQHEIGKDFIRFSKFASFDLLAVIQKQASKIINIASKIGHR